ncbi:hypothetical protein EB73_21165 [Mycobacterium sp. SWH-M3]|nr:hypothetical protein EB73_21165 [Mycobacterium sp. SWH-M3]
MFDKAKEQGIPVVLLIGSHRDWPTPDVTRYGRGEAIAVTTYSAIFNLNSHLSDAHVLVFDDAHAAEEYVGQAWALSVDGHTDAYHHLLDELADTLEPAFISRMVGPVGDNREVRLLPVAAITSHLDGIARVLTALSGRASYRFNMIRANLGACLFYVSRREIYIRPMIPPTFEHDAFTYPRQRLYLSATLGGAGELERAFGRAPIERVGVPPAWEKSGSGRRFFVFPDLVTVFPEPAEAEPRESDLAEQADSPQVADPTHESNGEAQGAAEVKTPLQRLVTELLGLSNKRLILTPDDESAFRLADMLGVDERDRYTARDADAGLQPFIDAETGTLLAPSRYDGMDLADDSCRMMLMAGLPKASHLQDQFLESKLGATEVLEERIRTRVLQGAGRCTRGPSDWAVVVVQGDELLRFLSRVEVQQALPVELQAEIAFGFRQEEQTADDLVYLAGSALKQDDMWREEAEPDLAEYRRAATRTPRPNADQLAASAPREVRAWKAAWQQDWEAATRIAVDVLEHLTAPALQPYYSLWAYLGSSWSRLAAETADDPTAAIERSAELLRRAHRAAKRTTWLKEVQPQAGEQVDSDPLNEASVDQVIARLQGPLRSPAKCDRKIGEMLSSLSQQKATSYEQGLTIVGEMIGAPDSFKPTAKGRADSVWIWDTLWICIEAKSEQDSGGMLSQAYIRQANTQLASLAGDRDVDDPPQGSVSVVVSPRGIVDPHAVPMAAPHLHLVTPSVMLDIAHDVARAWKQLRGIAPGASGAALHKEVAETMWEHRILPTQVYERLTVNPIRPST